MENGMTMGVPLCNAASTIAPVVGNVEHDEIAAFIQTLASSGVPIRGRKALQKLLYFAQFQGWPRNADYRLHLFGPYSDEVAVALDRLEATGAIHVDTERVIRPVALLQLAESPTLDQTALNAAKKVAAQFGRDDPRTLELLATLLFIWNREMSIYRRTTDYQLTRQVQKYKGPKFTLAEIESALHRLRDERYIAA